MKLTTLFLVSIIVKKLVYPIIRPHLKQAIDNPDKSWDDVAMRAADDVFDYKEKEEKRWKKKETF